VNTYCPAISRYFLDFLGSRQQPGYSGFAGHSAEAVDASGLRTVKLKEKRRDFKISKTAKRSAGGLTFLLTLLTL
jgi:hypothetical protein